MRPNRTTNTETTMNDEQLMKCPDCGSAIPVPPEPMNDTARLDWLERNLLRMSDAKASSSCYMDGKHVSCEFTNEARGRDAGPSTLRIRSTSIRDAIDEAINWTPAPADHE